PVIILACGFVVLNRYEHATYHPRYFRDMGARTFWHNALMGLGANSKLRTKYHVDIGDYEIIKAVINDMRLVDDPRLTDQWTNENIRNSLGGWSEFNWFDYESAARRFYFRIWWNSPPNVIRCYLFDKPTTVLKEIAHAWRSDDHSERNRNGLYFQPLSVL